MDMNPWAIFAFYLVILIPFGLVILKHRSLSQMSPPNMFGGKLMYFLSWIIVVMGTLLVAGFIFPTIPLTNILATSGIVLVPLLFVIFMLAIIYYGGSLLITGKGYFYPGSRYLLPVSGGDTPFSRALTRIWGFVFLFGGILLLLLLSSFTCNLLLKSNTGICSAPDILLKIPNQSITRAIIGVFLAILSSVSFIYWGIRKFKRDL